MIAQIQISPSRFVAIRKELELVALDRLPIGAGTARGPGTAEGWISGLANTRIVDPERNELIRFPALAAEIGQLMKFRRADGIEQVMVNRLDPGGNLAIHRDGRPYEPPPERWHLPVITNRRVLYWQEGDGMDAEIDGNGSPVFGNRVHMAGGSWWGPIEYWRLHRMANDGESSRLHLVVDLRVS